MTNILDRRALLAGMAVLPPAMLLPASAYADDAPRVTERGAGYYAMGFGDWRLVALNDGVRMRPYDTLLTRIAPGRARALYEEQLLGSPQPVSVNAYLIDTGERRVLVDAGAGTQMEPVLGHIVESLRAAGYQPEDVTDAIITHGHADHFGGLLWGESGRAFANATLHVSKAEADYWTSTAEEARAREQDRKTFGQMRRVLAPYGGAGRLKLEATGSPILPGITLDPRPGHSPGTVAVRATTGGRTVLFLGDMLHSAEVQFAHPELSISFDADQDTSAASRKAVLSDAADNGYWLAVAHLSFPGIGRVRREGADFRWIATTYGLDA